MHIPITLIYAAVLSLIFVGLSIRVIKHRFGTQVILGDGGHHKLNIAIRTHANFNEYIPLALILIMGVELLGYNSTLVHTLGIILVLARVSHIAGLATKKGAGAGRPIGVVATLLLMIASAVMILFRSF
ncbi:MAG: MAPEG family protein [Bdellovibrio sp.]|nr:MAPEG family protein [Bdellovibrio sp.]